MKKYILFFFLISIFSFSLKAQELSCKKICSKYLDCAQKYFNKKLNKKQSQKTTKDCLKSCRKSQKEVFACYKKASNQCVAFHKCLIDIYQKQSKK